MLKGVKYNKIFILGAGFSKSVSTNNPTLRDLTNALILEKDKHLYYDLVQFVSALNEISNESDEIMEIEKIATVILSKRLFYNNDEKLLYDKLRHQLLGWIYNKIEENSPKVDENKKDLLTHFLDQSSFLNNSKDHASPSLLMTFNYDLLLERLLFEFQHKDWTIDYIIRLNNYLNSYPSNIDLSSKKVLEYLKLHGSFNWFAVPGAQKIDLSNVYLVSENDPSRNLIHQSDIPVYIPMAFSKMQFLSGSLYNVIWNIAQSYLEEASEIYFIGYGFPQTDIDNLIFFLKFKSKIKDIVIFEPPESEKLRRLNKLFPDSNIINQDAFQYIVENHLGK
ncbi:MAG: SIR2 family protein [Flammeovirgaceae bacterium]|nr:SIR2 family protein [Flammeovirgaceae bacterium]